MSTIMRSLTTRRKEPELDPNIPNFLGRAASQRAGRPVVRTQISAPVALVSTTNVLSYNAPDIAGTVPIEHSASSSEESDGSGNSVHSHETDPTDLSSSESSPTTAEPGANHLSQYFKAAAVNATHKPKRSPSMASRTMDMVESPSPALPRRAPSHSKRAHEALSRKLSVQRARSPSASGRGVGRTRDSAEMFNSMATTLVESPKEPQLDAVAEELGSSPSNMTEKEFDAMYLRTKNLAHVSAADYVTEIDPYLAAYLDDSLPSVPDFSHWI